MKDTKINLIINADDFGYTKSINKGIIYAFVQGLISTTTLMVNMPHTTEAIELAKANPKLAVGLHIVLTVGAPLSKNCPTLIGKNGNFLGKDIIIKQSINKNEVHEEILAQLNFLFDNGINVDHIDTHHSLYKNEIILKEIQIIAKKYDLPVRKKIACDEIITTDGLLSEFYGDKAIPETILNFVKKNPHIKNLEIMTHCGFVDDETKRTSSYLSRKTEIQSLLQLKKQNFYETINLIAFKDLI